MHASYTNSRGVAPAAVAAEQLLTPHHSPLPGGVFTPHHYLMEKPSIKNLIIISKKK